MKTFIRRLLKTILGLVVVFIVVLAILIFTGVTVDLSKYRGAVETSIEAALDREITIDGSVYLEFSNWPAIDIEDVTLSNAEGASAKNMLEAGIVRLQVGLFPILRGEIEIGEITLEDVSLNLETDAEGKGNWVFSDATDDEGEKNSQQKTEDMTVEANADADADDKKLITFTGFNKLSLKNISFNYLDKVLNKSLQFELDSLTGRAPAGEPLKLAFSGRVQDKPYDLAIAGGPIGDLMKRDEPWAFSMDGEVIGRDVKAKGDMLVRNNKPEINLAFAIKQIDVGAILSALGLVEGMQASLGDMAIKVFLNGGSLKEIMENSTFLFKVNDANWTVAVPNSSALIEMTDMSGNVRVEKGNAVTMQLEGKLKDIPIKLGVTGAPLVEYLSKPDSIPLSIDMALLDSQISFSSTVSLPVTDKEMSLAMKFTSRRLDKLNKLFKLDLPAVGPVSLESQLNINNAGYEMPVLDLAVGKSNLKGKLLLDTTQSRPVLNIELASSLIRLEDFDSPEADNNKQQGEQDPQKNSAPAEDENAVVAEGPEEEKGLLSYEVLSALDATISIKANKITAEADDLGAALLNLSLVDARLAVEPLRLDVPGGKFELGLDYTLSPSSATLNLAADIEEFDIATLIRRKKPDADMGGIFTLEVDLSATASTPQALMKNASGKIDFALVPKNFSSGVIDLWAVNLLSAIMDKSTEKDKSTINCVVVRFGIEEGVMEEKAIYLDTTNMRIAGKVEINFVEETIDIKMAPKPKNPEFFNVAIPIKLKGSFEDFGIKIGILRMAGQVVSFVTSPIHVPIRRVFTEDEPADGVEACKIAWTRTAGD